MRFSIEIDPELVEQLSVAQITCLVVSGIVASIVLAGWFVPAFGSLLPSYWNFTKANTAFIALLSTISLSLSHPKQSRTACWLSRAFAGIVGIIVLAVLLEYVLHTTFWLELLLPHRAGVSLPGRMSPFTAIDFALLAAEILLLTQRKNALAVIADIVMCALSISVLVNVAGWIFGALRLFGVASSNRVGPATMTCLLLLTFVAFGRRAEHGTFAIMLGLGLGSRVARIAFPLAFVLPFVVEIGRGLAVRNNLLSPEYASAIATTFAVLLAFGLILILAWRVLWLEREILDLSLRDELTKLYNRRGFFLMAEQALWLAQRSGFSFSVLFVDLDGLKRINDTKGHDVGSDFICEAAELLQSIVRRTDVVGRVGGDEFVVAGQWNADEMRGLAERLREVVEERNAYPERIYPLSLSLGYVSSDGSESLQDLLQQADIAMYESKHRKKSHRP